MTLQPGKYLIKSKSQGTYIGRHVDEDRSLLPKRVLLLPPDFAPAPEWEVIMLDEGIYILKARSNHVTHFDNLVFAVLLPEPPATKWRIEAQPQHGQNIYTVSEAMGYDGWVCPEVPNKQIIARPLISTPSFPPMFPTNELFEFIAVDS